MYELQPWLESTPEQRHALNTLAQRLNLTYHNNSFGFINTYRYGLVSYSLRDTLSNFQEYLISGRAPYTTQGDPEVHPGYIECTILGILANFSTAIRDSLTQIFSLIDRRGTDRDDPLTDQMVPRIIYLPKGITDFTPNPAHKTIDIDLTAQLQREIIKENGADTSLPPDTPDKTITVKVATSPVCPEMLHVYTNKRSQQTLRRLIYKSLKIYFDRATSILETIPETELEAFKTVYTNFCVPKADSISNILAALTPYVDQHLAEQNKNLITDFAQAKQVAINQVRKHHLESQLESATVKFNENVAAFGRLKQELIVAQKNLDTFVGVSFDSIEVFLTKIKNSPTTKLFTKVNSQELQFLIEEPILYTDGKTWSKYLTNKYSEVYHAIQLFSETSAHKEHYGHTSTEILQYAVFRFFKELFVDQKYRIYTAALLYMNCDSPEIAIGKHSIEDATYFPHPHIGAPGLTCWGEATRAIYQELLDNDGETAYLQLTYALQQMTASDTVVASRFTKSILNVAYARRPIYLKKGETTFTTFEKIIKEFVQDETNKIAAIIASES